jgi:uncharacterized protein YeeX (DUF496 family)
MSIKRYDIDGFESNDGVLVNFADHQAEMASRDEQIEELKRVLRYLRIRYKEAVDDAIVEEAFRGKENMEQFLKERGK